MTAVLYIQLVGGLIYLLAGGDLLVRGAVALARRARVSPMIVALTVVAFGTSLPELVVVVRAALADHPGLVIGNVVGSNIANVLLVGGAAAAVYPLAGAAGAARRDSVIMIVVSIGFILLCASGAIGEIGGTVLLSGLAIVIAVAAVWGDLFSSALKREAGVKDAGHWLPGFGGLLDRIDSFVLAVPLVYYAAGLAGTITTAVETS